MYCVLLRKHIQLHFIPVLSKFHHNSLDFFFPQGFENKVSHEQFSGNDRTKQGIKQNALLKVSLPVHIYPYSSVHSRRQPERGEKPSLKKPSGCILRPETQKCAEKVKLLIFQNGAPSLWGDFILGFTICAAWALQMATCLSLKCICFSPAHNTI